MWNRRGAVILVLLIKKYCHCQDIMQDTTKLPESFEVTSGYAYVFNDTSTELTDNIEKWHRFDETVTISNIFGNIFNDYNTSNIEWKTDNLSIFGTNDTQETINWNIFDSTIVTTEGTRYAKNLEHLVTPAVKIYDEHVDLTDISNTEPTDSFGDFIESTATTEFAANYNNDEESTTYVYCEDKIRATDDLNMTALILKMVEELKNPDHVGIPGLNIPDPNLIPDMSQSITIFDTLYFTNSTVQGLSKLKMLHFNVDVEALEVHTAMHIDRLRTSGNYRYSSFMMPRSGPYNVDIYNLTIIARANLGVQRDGKLRTQDIIMELDHQSIDVNIENLDPLLAGIIKGAGNFIFDTAKPQMLQDAYTNARTAIDTELEKTAEDMQFPNSLPPLDMILIDVGKRIRKLGLDPYSLKDYVNNDTMSFVSVALYDTWITGISTVHRLRDITIKVANGTAIIDFGLATGTIEGSTHWDVSIGKIMSSTGKASFTVEHVSIRLIISQPLDIRTKPKLEDLQIDIGNLQMRSDGAGTMDYILEFTVNIVPNILRYQIVDALGWPLRSKIQEELDKMNVEEMIKRELIPRIVEMEKSGFKLSSLRAGKEDEYDVDEFFNF